MNELSFSKRVIETVKQIPRGRVATYGQVAALAGNPRASRQVVWAMVSFHGKGTLPWHRVINRQGKISLRGEGFRLQRDLLEAEGVAVGEDGTVDLEVYRWRLD